MSPETLTTTLKDEARRLGFDLAGAAPAVAPPTLQYFRQWLADGYAGQMHYLADREDAYEHPRHVMDGARSILMLATLYRSVEPVPPGPGQGTVSRYAWGSDYHEVVRRRLHRLADFHRRLTPEATVRGVVDTAPLLERQFAQLAGLGWIGKNTMLLNRRLGSWFTLAALLTSEPLTCDAPMDNGYCGNCRACLDACPTGALVAPYQLDARKCISYLTIEPYERAPPDLRPSLGQRVFGCDACQDACPWNRRTLVTADPSFQPRPGMNPIDLTELLALDEEGFRKRFRGMPQWRPGRSGLLGSVAVALGNRQHSPALPALLRGLEDGDSEVREACLWALGRYEGSAAKERPATGEPDS
jgi:epoxyqueuosine reductase